jgi:putative ABC transport system ATP-binding protein
MVAASQQPYRPAPPAPDTSEVLMSLEDIGKDYVSEAATVHALRRVDLTIKRGEFVAMVGQSGSGKSTMMNIIGCLDRPTRGRYLLDGIDVTHRSNDERAIVRNRLIGFVFQGFNLLPRTTALENVELPLVYRGIAASERKKRAIKALESVNLSERLHHTPNQLSGGQQQRVAIARALVTEPPLLLADEPTGNLDTRTSYEVLGLLQALNHDKGITIVLVTHEPDIAACAKRVITMRDGRVRSDVVNEHPHDAIAALAALPAVEEAQG